MKESRFTIQERQFLTVMQSLAVLFFMMGIAIFVIPDLMINTINDFFSKLLSKPLSTFKIGDQHFLLVICTSSFWLLSYMCIKACREDFRLIELTKIVLLAKILSALVFFAIYLFYHNAIIYPLAAIIDICIVFFTWSSYRRAVFSRPRSFLS